MAGGSWVREYNEGFQLPQSIEEGVDGTISLHQQSPFSQNRDDPGQSPTIQGTDRYFWEPSRLRCHRNRSDALRYHSGARGSLGSSMRISLELVTIMSKVTVALMISHRLVAMSAQLESDLGCLRGLLPGLLYGEGDEGGILTIIPQVRIMATYTIFICIAYFMPS
ncbi:hypothetical protein FRC02_007594 [Tulasnella sp. 418]|nr:hypothetical protein FRC02_007594 [Tulasnella sp. 418]